MRKLYIKGTFFALFLTVSCALFSQNVAINTSGNSAYVSAILDLSNHNTSGSVGFLPPYVDLNLPLSNFQLTGAPATAVNSNGIIIYSTGAGTAPAGLYYWNNAGSTWVAMGGAGGTLTGGGTTNYLARWTSATNLGTGLTQDNGVEVGIQTGAYAFTAGNPLLQVTANSSNINAILGTTSQTGGAGVSGSLTNSGSSGGYGVNGSVTGAGGGFAYAIYGASTVTAGNGIGVWGQSTGIGASINYGGYFTASGGTSNYGVVVPNSGGFSGFYTTTPVNTVDDNGSIGTGITTVSAATTLDATSSTVLATPSAAAAYTITLPTIASTLRRIYTIVYNGTVGGTANTQHFPITIAAAAGDKIVIDGLASAATVPLQSGSLTLQNNGSNWYVTSGVQHFSISQGGGTGGLVGNGNYGAMAPTPGALIAPNLAGTAAAAVGQDLQQNCYEAHYPVNIVRVEGWITAISQPFIIYAFSTGSCTVSLYKYSPGITYNTCANASQQVTAASALPNAVPIGSCNVTISNTNEAGKFEIDVTGNPVTLATGDVLILWVENTGGGSKAWAGEWTIDFSEY